MNRPISQYLGVSIEGFDTPDKQRFCKLVLNDDDHAKNQWPFFIVGRPEDLRKLAENFLKIADEMDGRAPNNGDEAPAKKETKSSPGPKNNLKKFPTKDTEHEGAPA